MKLKDLIKDLSKYKDQEMQVVVHEPNNPFSEGFNILHTICKPLMLDNKIETNFVVIVIDTHPSREPCNEL
jgi:hypothetical protein